MTNQERKTLNHFLVKIFHEILKIEELCISNKTFSNLSLREIHVLEAVYNAEGQQGNNCSTAVASALHITPGTLSTAVSMLEKKGFIFRKKDARDKRIVHLYTTDLGRQAQQKHSAFHDEMVEDIASLLSDEEAAVFCRSLQALSGFFFQKYSRLK